MAKPKILLIDADVKSRQMLEISLKKAGFSVTTTEEGEKALQLMDTYMPDLIISDIDLAGSMDGYLFCQVLKERKDSQHIPFVFLTTRKEVEDKIRGLELGVDDYLTKPIYLKEVIARARIIVDKKKQENIDNTGTEPLFQGDLSQMSIVDLLQTMEFGQKTGILHLDKAGHSAKIYIKLGRVVHAVCDNLVGERAVYRTLLWSEGQFQIDFKKSLQTQETIQVSTQALIMEGMRRIDELERIKEQLPPFDCQLTIDSETILEEHPDRFPAKIENILAEFNGQQALEDVVDSLPYDDLESLEIISKLYFQGYLIETDEQTEAPSQAGPGRERTSAESPTESKLAPGGATLDTQMLNLDSASKSIEEIKAKAKLAAKQQSGKTSATEAETKDVAPPASAPPEQPVAPQAEAPKQPAGPSFDMAPPDQEEQQAAVRPPAPTEQAPAKPPAAQPSAATSDVPASPPEQPAASTEVDDEAARQLFEDSPDEEQEPESSPQTPTAKKKPATERPQGGAASHVARIVPVPMTSEAPKHDMNPVPQEQEREPDRIAARRQQKSEHAPADAPVNTAPPVQHQVPAPGYPQGYPAQGPGRPAGQPGQSTLTQFGDNTLMQFGDATMYGQDGDDGRRKLWLGGGLALLLIGILAGVLILRQSGNGLLQSGTDADDLYAVAQRAFEMVQEGQWASAKRLAGDVLEQDPNLPVALYARGKASEQLGKLPEAMTDYQKALEINPAFHLARYDLVKMQFEQGQAVQPLREAVNEILVKLDPSDDAGLYRKAQILGLKLDIAAEDWSQARETLKQAQAFSPNDPQLVILAGRIPEPTPAPKQASSRPAPQPAAAKPVRKATPEPKPDPEPPKMSAADEAKQLHEKGIGFYRKGYLRNAKRTLQEATKLDPKNDEIWVDLGQVLVELGEDREAMEVFTTAGKLEPRNPRVWNNLGSLYLYQGDNERARKAFETYLDLVPPDSQQAKEIQRVLENLF